LRPMSHYHDDRLDGVFQALSHPTRREIVSMLSTKPYTIGELVPEFDMSFNAVSKHIKILERAKIIDREIKGRTHFCRLNTAALDEAHSWLGGYEQFWQSRLKALTMIMESGND
jgi:DNA-binding transcriptional ArsR family regulator